MRVTLVWGKFTVHSQREGEVLLTSLMPLPLSRAHRWSVHCSDGRFPCHGPGHSGDPGSPASDPLPALAQVTDFLISIVFYSCRVAVLPSDCPFPPSWSVIPSSLSVFPLLLPPAPSVGSPSSPCRQPCHHFTAWRCSWRPLVLLVVHVLRGRLPSPPLPCPARLCRCLLLLCVFYPTGLVSCCRFLSRCYN